MTRARDLANIADGTFTATDLDLSGTLTVSGDANFDSGSLFVDVSANRVGIGTTSPDFTLDVAGGIARERSSSGSTASPVTDQVVGLNAGGNFAAGLTAINTNSSNFDVSLGFLTRNASGDGVERVRIDADGNVGIGTSSPISKLYIEGDQYVVTASGVASNGIHVASATAAAIDTYGGAISFDTGSTGASGIAAVNDGAADTDSNGLAFFTHGSGTGGADAVERMRISHDGNVGIGTQSPKTIINASTSTGAILTLESSDTSLTTNDVIGGIDFYANDGSTNGTGAKVNIRGIATSTAGTITALTFGTSDSSSATATERMRIDGSGNLMVGKSTSDIGATAGFEWYDTGNVLLLTRSAGQALSVNRLTSDGDLTTFRKDGSTIGSIGIRTSRLYFAQTGGSGIAMSGVNLLPTDGTGAPNDNTNDIGFSSFRFDDIYATNGTIQTSDANEKQDIRDLSEAEARVAQAAKALLKAFRWKDAVAKKGDDARIHFGIIAQDLQAAFEAEGLDAGRYGMFIHSTWTDEETGEERSRMGVRYSELLAFIIAAL